jgi:hypothetical protein
MGERSDDAPNGAEITVSKQALRAAVQAEVLDWFGGPPEQWRSCSDVEAELLAEGVLKRLPAR